MRDRGWKLNANDMRGASNLHCLRLRSSAHVEECVPWAHVLGVRCVVGESCVITFAPEVPREIRTGCSTEDIAEHDRLVSTHKQALVAHDRCCFDGLDQPRKCDPKYEEDVRTSRERLALWQKRGCAASVAVRTVGRHDILNWNEEK